jgi:uncharacterized protein (TIGR02246 family)
MLSQVLTLLGILALGHPLRQPSSGAAAPDDVAELTPIEHRLVKAWLEGDRETVAAVLAPDWAVIDLTGRMLSRSQVLEEGFGSKERKIESGSIDEINVRLFKDVAVVTGRSTLTGSYKSERMTVVQRFTDVFARSHGRWQAVASQGTQIAPTDAAVK